MIGQRPAIDEDATKLIDSSLTFEKKMKSEFSFKMVSPLVSQFTFSLNLALCVLLPPPNSFQQSIRNRIIKFSFDYSVEILW